MRHVPTSAPIPPALAVVLARVAEGEPLGSAARVASERVDALYAIGRAALVAGRLRDAQRHLAFVVALQPERSRGWAGLAIACDRLGARLDASAFFAIAAGLDGSAPLWLRAAESALVGGSRRGAAACARRALEAGRCTELERQRATLVLEEVNHDD